VLEPIQDISTDDALAESSRQAERDKATEDVIDVVLVEQSDPQRVNISDTSVGQPQRPLDQADLQLVEE
jgi:hypothetical protein